MWNGYGTDDLFHWLATTAVKAVDGTDGTDVFFKKEFEKRRRYIHAEKRMYVCA